jgi:hypothetical protein
MRSVFCLQSKLHQLTRKWRNSFNLLIVNVNGGDRTPDSHPAFNFVIEIGIVLIIYDE